ncbi:hypothetical protein FFLO_03492 [Filobasidium floriforme]|uniref:Uncharacterized protein n=1 Tax=Filobasidium floriforme TaxID=5210 RepID=A0A8K0NQ82_9TREE|nr:hypothetical protein FFLO_03492 [Filobasidium floriforme]
MSATAKTTLPKLLAGLPKYGQGQLVQPVSWKTKYPNSFYKITRTKLRFQQVDEAGKPIVASAVADKGKAKEQPREEDEFEEDNDDGDIFGELAEEEIVAQQTGGRPHGKAWGVLFWNGQPKIPTRNARKSLTPDASTSIIPETVIRGRLKESWTPLDTSALNAEIRQAVDGLQTGRKAKLQTGYVQTSRAERREVRKDRKEMRQEKLKSMTVVLPAGEV